MIQNQKICKTYTTILILSNCRSGQIADKFIKKGMENCQKELMGTQMLKNLNFVAILSLCNKLFL
jgi:hypothetical protein